MKWIDRGLFICIGAFVSIILMMILYPSVDTISDNSVVEKIAVDLTVEELNLINSFSPDIRDAAYYFKSHPEEIELYENTFKCGSFSIWVEVENSYLHLSIPRIVNMTLAEREYFMKLYAAEFNAIRLYHWEDSLIIRIEN